MDADVDADVLGGVVGGWMGDLVAEYIFASGSRGRWIDRERERESSVYLLGEL